MELANKFHTNYIKSLIKSNTEFKKEEVKKPQKFYATMIQNYHQTSNKQKRSARRHQRRYLIAYKNTSKTNAGFRTQISNVDNHKYDKRSHKSKDLLADAKKLENIRINNMNILQSKYNNSRNIQDKIYRSGTEELAVHRLGKNLTNFS